MRVAATCTAFTTIIYFRYTHGNNADIETRSSHPSSLEHAFEDSAHAPSLADLSTRRIPSTPLTYDDYLDPSFHLSSEFIVESAQVSAGVDQTIAQNVVPSSATSLENNLEEEENNHPAMIQHQDAFTMSPSVRDYEEECSEWALHGECNANPAFMIRRCTRSCLKDLNTEDNDLLAWGIIEKRNPNDGSCEDLHAIDLEEGLVPPEEEGCLDWAMDGLCKSIDDKQFMLRRCARSCMVCIPHEVNDFEIGVPQEITENYFFEETLNVMIETSRYMSLAVMDTTNTEFESVRKDCKNLDPYCAQRAAKGGCDPNSDDYEWIVLKCAPTCHTCELLDFSIRCPIPENAKEALSRNGGEFGLNAMFERIVGERELTNEQSMEGMEDLNYTAIIYSRPSTNISGEVMDLSSENIIDGPWVISLDNFLTDKECDRLIELGIEQGYGQSTEQSTNRDGSISEKTASKRRTSTNTFCGTCDDDPIAKFVLNKIATITGFPLEFSEELQLLQYHPGQYYKRHNDYIPSHTHGPSGPRVMTVLLYLNDVEEGGGTRFNELSETARPVDVKPKKGSAVLWPSVLDKDVLTRDIRTDHEALVVEKGMKYAANAWLHLRDEKNAEGIACG